MGSAKSWLSPIRPGLLGTVSQDSSFVPTSLIHFWPSHDEFGLGEAGQHVPLYIHQKKSPGRKWQEIVTFTTPLGNCSHFASDEHSTHHQSMQSAFHAVNTAHAQMWFVAWSHPNLLQLLRVVEDQWELGWQNGLHLLQRAN